MGFKKLWWATKVAVMGFKAGVFKFLRDYAVALVAIGMMVQVALAYMAGVDDEVFNWLNFAIIMLIFVVWMFVYGVSTIIAVTPAKPPTPVKRFTHKRADGEVTIEQVDVPEIILYLDTLEDWFEQQALTMPSEEE